MALLEVRNLTTYYRTSAGYNQALDHFSIELERGETLGLIGESGCGKSTAGFSILNMAQSPGKIMEGEVFLNGRNIMTLSPKEHRNLLWREIAMIPQSAMNALNPMYKIGDQIIEAIRLHFPVITRREAVDKSKLLLTQVGLDEKWFSAYPHKLSGGMKQRAIIAMALSCDPSVIISDESTTGLDVLIQAQILALLKRLQRERELSLIVISHDLNMVSAICERIGVMYAGKLVEIAATEELQADPRHPYMQALFDSNIEFEDFDGKVESIDGVVPKLIDPINRCHYYSRCTKRTAACDGGAPELIHINETHLVACHREGKYGD